MNGGLRIGKPQGEGALSSGMQGRKNQGEQRRWLQSHGIGEAGKAKWSKQAPLWGGRKETEMA